MINHKGQSKCAFVTSRSRVAPLKRTTIPRLELTAACVAARMDRKLRDELDLQISRSIFWTDSTAVLKYISNDKARYQTFVANRVKLIRELTDLSSWRYVDSANNPADIASRGLSVTELLESKIGSNSLPSYKMKWTRGP